MSEVTTEEVEFEFHVEVDWTYGVDPRIVNYVDAVGISEDRVQVISETEIIIHNNPR